MARGIAKNTKKNIYIYISNLIAFGLPATMLRISEISAFQSLSNGGGLRPPPQSLAGGLRPSPAFVENISIVYDINIISSVAMQVEKVVSENIE